MEPQVDVVSEAPKDKTKDKDKTKEKTKNKDKAKDKTKDKDKDKDKDKSKATSGADGAGGGEEKKKKRRKRRREPDGAPAGGGGGGGGGGADGTTPSLSVERLGGEDDDEESDEVDEEGGPRGLGGRGEGEGEEAGPGPVPGEVLEVLHEVKPYVVDEVGLPVVIRHHQEQPPPSPPSVHHLASESPSSSPPPPPPPSSLSSQSSVVLVSKPGVSATESRRTDQGDKAHVAEKGPPQSTSQAHTVASQPEHQTHAQAGPHSQGHHPSNSAIAVVHEEGTLLPAVTGGAVAASVQAPVGTVSPSVPHTHGAAGDVSGGHEKEGAGQRREKHVEEPEAGAQEEQEGRQKAKRDGTHLSSAAALTASLPVAHDSTTTSVVSTAQAGGRHAPNASASSSLSSNASASASASTPSVAPSSGTEHKSASHPHPEDAHNHAVHSSSSSSSKKEDKAALPAGPQDGRAVSKVSGHGGGAKAEEDSAASGTAVPFVFDQRPPRHPQSPAVIPPSPPPPPQTQAAVNQTASSLAAAGAASSGGRPRGNSVTHEAAPASGSRARGGSVTRDAAVPLPGPQSQPQSQPQPQSAAKGTGGHPSNEPVRTVASDVDGLPPSALAATTAERIAARLAEIAHYESERAARETDEKVLQTDYAREIVQRLKIATDSLEQVLQELKVMAALERQVGEAMAERAKLALGFGDTGTVSRSLHAFSTFQVAYGEARLRNANYIEKELIRRLAVDVDESLVKSKTLQRTLKNASTDVDLKRTDADKQYVVLSKSLHVLAEVLHRGGGGAAPSASSPAAAADFKDPFVEEMDYLSRIAAVSEAKALYRQEMAHVFEEFQNLDRHRIETLHKVLSELYYSMQGAERSIEGAATQGLGLASLINAVTDVKDYTATAFPRHVFTKVPVELAPSPSLVVKSGVISRASGLWGSWTKYDLVLTPAGALYVFTHQQAVLEETFWVRDYTFAATRPTEYVEHGGGALELTPRARGGLFGLFSSSKVIVFRFASPYISEEWHSSIVALAASLAV